MIYRIAFFIVFLTACTTQKDQQNRLLNSASPYLREHADNPVHWYPWGEEALALATKENKPVIVSIGYAACHWCHVMEKESFMDPEVAALMNENFISIKVDREERPDVDQQYVHASEILTGTAGWPLNAFALPNGDAFHVITYYPKDAWIKLLTQVSKAWKEKRNDLEKQATAIAQNVDQLNTGLFAGDMKLRFDIPAFLNNTQSWFEQLDVTNGGLKGNMKFPLPSITEFMLQHSELTNHKQSKQWVTTTLDAMINGGLYDHLAGGFARYTTDSLWRVPHFEKMLYDNAQLLSLYSHAFKATGNKNYERVIRETISFIEATMTSPEGGFYSSVNADSEGEEGKFYKWNDAEVSKYFEVYDGVLNLKKEPVPDSVKKRLLAKRNQRTHPSIDEKIITSWNAMMIVGLIDAFTALGDQHYLDMALKTAKLLDTEKTVYRLPNVEGFLDDYAWLAKAYIQLYQSTFDVQWLNKSIAITDLALQKFLKKNSALFLYSTDTAFNNIELFDNVIPSSNSVFAEVLFQTGDYFQDANYTMLATKAVEQAIGPIDIEGVHLANWARIAETMNFSPYEIAITGERSLEFARELQRSSLPPSIFLGGNKEDLPLLENKLVKNKTMIYVCKNRTCKLPVEDPKEALRQVRK
jgi:uncharacterized protein YyaL (SSP411 family)